MDTVVECKIGHGSGDLVDVFKREGAPSSNDTSFGVGYAPFSETENLVKATEELLNSKAFKAKHPAVGEDIKVMGLREGEKNYLNYWMCNGFKICCKQGRIHCCS